MNNVTICVFFLMLTNLSPIKTFSYHRLRPGCEFMTNDDWIKPQALLLNAEKTKIILPGFNDSVYVPPLGKVVLACPNSTLLFNNVSTFETGTTVKCIRGTSIKIKGSNYDIKAVSCEKLPRSSTRIVGTCFNLEKILQIEVGFHVGNNFIKIMTICFNSESLNTVYSHYNLSSKIIARQVAPRPNSFDPAGYYDGLTVSKLYNRNTERKTIGNILGSQELGEKYIQQKTGYFLSRGHLTAKADFIYAPQQFATFYYINVAPQWGLINGGNWMLLEDSVRRYAIKFNLDLSVYTIPYGILTLPDVNGNLQEIHLYQDGNSANKFTISKIKVPKFFVKILFNEKEKRATAFVTANNPYLDDITDDYQLCDDICEMYSWLLWKAKNIKNGYSYCCSYEQIKMSAVGEYLPELSVNGPLAY